MCRVLMSLVLTFAWTVSDVRIATAEDGGTGPNDEDGPHEVYTVRPGDTLSQVAVRHSTSVERLLLLNDGLTDADHIFPDQQLRVPLSVEHALEEPPPQEEYDESTTVTCDLPLVAEEQGIALPILREEVGPTPERLVFAGRVSPEFQAKVREVAQRLEMDPDHLMTIIHYETGGSFRPSIRNPYTNAVGLIQFLPSTARLLGTSAETLAAMSGVEQLDWVETYLTPFRGRLGTIEDAYMAVLYPAAVGSPNDYVLFRRGSSAYERNPGLDRDDDGVVTRGEVCTAVAAVLQRGIDARAAASPTPPVVASTDR